MGITEIPIHVILPKSTGLLYSLHALRPEVHTLIDITVGYAGLTPTQIPYDEYLVENVFFKNKAPPSIHMHVRKFDVDKIPGFEECNEKVNTNIQTEKAIKINDLDAFMNDPERKSKFDIWLRARFMEKDHLMKNFYATGEFNGDLLDDSKKYSLEVGISQTPMNTNIKRKDVEVVDVSPELQDWIVFGFLWYALFYLTGPGYIWIIRMILVVFF